MNFYYDFLGTIQLVNILMNLTECVQEAPDFAHRMYSGSPWITTFYF